MTKTIEEILVPKPEARLRIYAYSINDEAHLRLLKVGQTTRDVKQRIAEQLKTAAIKNYRIELDEPADRAVVRRFPFSVIYRETESTIIIYAIFGSRQDPEKWRERLQ
jgi:plasmid stabilization system protein ParE